MTPATEAKIATLKVEVGLNQDKAKRLLALVEAVSIANANLQSALEHLSSGLLDGSLELQSVPASFRSPITKLDVVAAGAVEDLPILNATGGDITLGSTGPAVD